MTFDASDLRGREWDDGIDATVRFAVVGLGGFAREVALPALAGADYCEPTVLVSGSPDVADDLASDYDARVVDYEGYEDGVADEEYDAVYVATPNALHRDHVEAAAALGKDVVCEKPLAATADDAAATVEACREADVRLMTAYRMQLDPVVRHLRDAHAGLVGDTVQLSGDFSDPAIDESSGPDQWRLDGELAGGGALMDLGVYLLNTARFLLDADPVAASAETSGDGPFDEVEEHVAFQLSFPDDVTASFTANYSGYPDDRLTIDGAEGRLELADAFQPRRSRHVTLETAELRHEVDTPRNDEMRAQFDYFAHALRTGGEIDPDGRDGLRDVRAMEAIYEAAETGRRVEIDYEERFADEI